MGEAPEHDQIRRSVTVTVLKARADAARFTDQLDEKPFWRFRRRQQLNKALARAEQRERAALRLLGGQPED